MYNAEFHIHPQVDGKYDLDENDAIIFSKEADHIYDVKRLDDLWDVIEEHPELDDITFMVEAFITEEKEEENEIVEAEAVEEDTEDIEEDEVKDEADEGNKYLEDWKFVAFADVLRIVDTPIDSNPDINQIYRDGSTLSIMAYEEGELPNLNGMVSNLGPEERVCSFDDSGHLILGPIGTAEDEEDIAPDDGSDDNDEDGEDNNDNEDTDDEDDSGNTSVGDDGKIELNP